MRNLLLLIMACLMCFSIQAQEKLYLILEFMRVDNSQESLYQDVEGLWEKLHQERVKNGDIIGWDLWSLKPGGEDQGFQYMTSTLFDNPVQMMSGAGDWEKAFEAATKNMSKEDLETFDKTSESRDLAVRIYAEMISETTGDNPMPLGTLAQLDFMKVDLGNYESYEKAEMEVFKPMHQADVDNNYKEYWGLMRFMLPYGSDTHASHMTVNMFTVYDQVFMERKPGPELTESQKEAIQKGLKTRDYKKVYHGTLIRKVR